jgi:hypothetical protein
MTQYIFVHQNGMPLINNVTAEPDSYILDSGQRLFLAKLRNTMSTPYKIVTKDGSKSR